MHHRSENATDKQTVLNIDEHLASLAKTEPTTTPHPGAAFDVDDATHDEIAGELNDQNNGGNTGIFHGLYPALPPLNKTNEPVSQPSNYHDLENPVDDNTRPSLDSTNGVVGNVPTGKSQDQRQPTGSFTSTQSKQRLKSAKFSEQASSSVQKPEESPQQSLQENQATLN